MDVGPDEDDDFTDIREQIFHNTVREQIVSVIKWLIDLIYLRMGIGENNRHITTTTANTPLQIYQTIEFCQREC